MEYLAPYLPTIIGSLLSGIFGLNVMFFKWLLSSFKDLRSDLKANVEAMGKIQEVFMKMLDNHENLDQRRHEENLYRFEKVSVALARLGSSNGTYNKELN